MGRDKLELVSHFAGRLRVRAETFRVLPEVGDEVVEELRAHEGVTSASLSRVTGSVLVTYDATVLQLPRLLALIIRTGALQGIALEPALGEAAPPSGGARVRSALGAFNGRLHGASGGAVDLSVAVPGVLTGTGLLMLLAGRRRIPEWYDLLFWGFTAFCSLNPPRYERGDPDDDVPRSH
ncbi:MAG TPA: hypothetical protein VNW92_14945 [Polyangiaceae bacterium]|nr:hypothetical protein [Polyangiaceae bacterium]